MEREPAATGFVDSLKSWIAALQGVATIGAILAGAYWFFLQRSTKPQVKLDQTVTQRPVVGDDDEILITVDVRATNIGKVKVDLQPGQFDLLRLNPPQGGPLISYALRALSLEPGESDQALFKTVIVRSSVKTVQVHSDYKVPGTGNNYWNLLSAVDIGDHTGHKESDSSVR
jgi:hypothetical protein